MNEKNKIRSKAWPLAAAALVLGLGGVVGASAVYADRADDAANFRPSQSVKMRVEYDDQLNWLSLIVPYGSYVDVAGASVNIRDDNSSLRDGGTDVVEHGDSVEGAYMSSDELSLGDIEYDDETLNFTLSVSDEPSGYYYAYVNFIIGGESRDVAFCWQTGAEDAWKSYEIAEDELSLNLNYVPKDLIGQIFDDVGGGVTGVANTIGTSVTSVVGLFWDVENVRFTTLGTLTLVGLAAGLVYFAIRTIYRAVNGVA